MNDPTNRVATRAVAASVPLARHRSSNARSRTVAGGLVASIVLGGCNDGRTHFAGTDGAASDGGTDGDGTAAAPVEVWGGGRYDLAGFTPAVVTGCDVTSCRPIRGACVDHETCGNGLDDDCNGSVDEGCSCQLGDTQRCLAAPPGVVLAGGSLRGACAYGTQTCTGTSEFGTWSGCSDTGQLAPEVCNGLDDNCNGCADEGLCCPLPAACPTTGDPRVPTGSPYARTVVHGAALLAGAMSYAWHVEGGACDRMQYATAHRTSYTVEGGTGSDPRESTGETFAFVPTRPGDYAVTLTAARPGGTFSCTFVLPVRTPGLWVESCWDTGATDTLDPWLARANVELRPATVPNATVCTPGNCAPDATMRPDWGLGDTAGASCAPVPVAATAACPNPRLIASETARRTIVVDDPGPDDRFRVFLDFHSSTAAAPRTVQPVIELFCGGVPAGTMGGADLAGEHFGEFAVTGFDAPGTMADGSLWRVADVSDVRGGGCVVDRVHVRGARTGACVSTGTDRTFDGPCGSPP